MQATWKHQDAEHSTDSAKIQTTLNFEQSHNFRVCRCRSLDTVNILIMWKFEDADILVFFSDVWSHLWSTTSCWNMFTQTTDLTLYRVHTLCDRHCIDVGVCLLMLKVLSLLTLFECQHSLGVCRGVLQVLTLCAWEHNFPTNILLV